MYKRLAVLYTLVIVEIFIVLYGFEVIACFLVIISVLEST